MNKKEKLEAMSEEELLYELLWKKHKAIDPNQIISSETLPTGVYVVRVGGITLKENEVENLRSEIKMIQGTRAWKLITETLNAKAEESIFRASKDIEEIKYGKAMLMSISIINNIFNTFQRPNLNRNPQDIQNEQLSRSARTRYQSK